MTVAENFRQIQREIEDIAKKCGRDPAEITLVAVTKGHSLEHVMPAYEAGCRDFGENRVQEGLSKISHAPQDLRWHLIGTLQKNKVRKVIGTFVLIHSVDSLDLAKKLSECSQEKGIVTPILLQANTSGEKAKHGLQPEEWKNNFEKVLRLPGILVKGLMTMAPLENDEGVIRRCFSNVRELREDLQKIAGEGIKMAHLSMGMTHDYSIAIEEGATILRIGTAIFGERKTLL
ncbi:MAG: YggS family pyridoxal phosphate-dependent enzyme [Waddliaceae bacterium]